MNRCVVLACLLFAIAIDLNLAWGASGQVLVLPFPRTKVRSGLRLSVDPRWVSGSGYRPVRVRVSPIAGGAAPADRYIDIRLRPHGWYGGKAGAVSATIQLPQGAMFGETTVNIPQTNNWTSFDIDAWEDGKYLRDLEANLAGQSSRYYYEASDATPSVLVLNRMAPDWSQPIRQPSYTGQTNGAISVVPTMVPAAGGLTLQPILAPQVTAAYQTDARTELRFLPDIRVLAGRFPMSYYNGYVTADRMMAKTAVPDAEIMRLTNDLTHLDIVPPHALPDSWISFSGVDVVIVSLDELQSMSVELPEKFEAIRTWLSTGPLICVYGVGNDFSRLSQLAKLLGIRTDTGESAAKVEDWLKPSPKQYREEITSLVSANGGNAWWQQQAVMQMKTVVEDSGVNQKPSNVMPFVYRSVGQGQVVAMAADNPFPGTERDWSWIFNTIPSRHWLWYQRNGLSNQQENRDFWKFLITDIGRAPVMSFLTLITLFAVVIGPVNYYVLHRRGRVYMLLVTVPAGAFIVTTGLFLYATFADGLGIRTRMRSFTEIDQRERRSMTWSRQTYYAGLAPSRGLVFPAETAVFPIDYQPGYRGGGEDTSRHIIWGEQQNLAAGYFLSRTPSQMLVVEPRKTEAGLKITEGSGEGPPQVKNELAVAILRLMLRDSQGRYFFATNVDKDATVTLNHVKLADESLEWKKLYGAQRLAYPEGFNPASLENVSGIFGGMYIPPSDTTGPSSFDTSLLESSIRESTGMDFRSLSPRSYVAIVNRPPFVSLGVETAGEKASFHVIAGRW